MSDTSLLEIVTEEDFYYKMKISRAGNDGCGYVLPIGQAFFFLKGCNKFHEIDFSPSPKSETIMLQYIYLKKVYLQAIIEATFDSV